MHDVRALAPVVGRLSGAAAVTSERGGPLTPTRAETWGTRLLVLSGLPPLTVGLLSYALFILSRHAPVAPWQTLLGPLGFSLGEIERTHPDLAAFLLLVNHMGWANLITSGVLISTLSGFGIRRRQRWCWLAVLFVHVWTGSNDLIAALDFGAATGKHLPLPIVPMSLALVGLALTARGCWRPEPEPPEAAPVQMPK